MRIKIQVYAPGDCTTSQFRAVNLSVLTNLLIPSSLQWPICHTELLCTKDGFGKRAAL